MYHKLHIDYVVSVSPKYAGPPLGDDRDMFGCGFRQVTYDGDFYKECVFHPLAAYETVEELDADPVALPWHGLRRTEA